MQSTNIKKHAWLSCPAVSKSSCIHIHFKETYVQLVYHANYKYYTQYYISTLCACILCVLPQYTITSTVDVTTNSTVMMSFLHWVVPQYIALAPTSNSYFDNCAKRMKGKVKRKMKDWLESHQVNPG